MLYIDTQLMSLTNSTKTAVRNIIQRDLDAQYMELQISTIGARKFIEFISIHESYEKKSEAEDRVKQFMSDRLTQTLSEDKKDLGVSKGVSSEVTERKTFLSSLDSSYKKKSTEPQKKGDLREIKRIQDKVESEKKKKEKKKHKKKKK